MRKAKLVRVRVCLLTVRVYIVCVYIGVCVSMCLCVSAFIWKQQMDQ
jgi:hypothetical protein